MRIFASILFTVVLFVISLGGSSVSYTVDLFFISLGGKPMQKKNLQVRGGKSMQEYLGEVYAIFPIS